VINCYATVTKCHSQYKRGLLYVSVLLTLYDVSYCLTVLPRVGSGH